MDCVGLRSDIGRLREEVSALEANSKKMRESGATSKDVGGVMGMIDSNAQDSILKKYLKNFQEQNPEILPILSLRIITVGRQVFFLLRILVTDMC